jgi:hypothetical protein
VQVFVFPSSVLILTISAARLVLISPPHLEATLPGSLIRQAPAFYRDCQRIAEVVKPVLNPPNGFALDLTKNNQCRSRVNPCQRNWWPSCPSWLIDPQRKRRTQAIHRGFGLRPLFNLFGFVWAICVFSAALIRRGRALLLWPARG